MPNNQANIYFVKNDDEDFYELWANGRYIESYYPTMEDDGVDMLIKDLVRFANIPVYQNISDEIIEEMKGE